ncbi:flagellar hook-basal body complex protein [Polynucleobacter sp. 30F-ANTBAC]|uniref:flagellar hook-basal body complex protein n=1 Tax=Polynucleobacter sp. 30F-ANTBAC TaxID=2689095 RepID=UPI001C0C0722|nr:flagellar hook-basal body complex protein [Polynucleobacter sp. 30F-ANTBAC]MBU3599756.1 flagellar hook-basal body complex protein [Polynucleobacter sp. 30F-ANTBAC]
MSNYTIALSGLQNTSLAIDTTSNNIANANTVGYKAGEYVFADQYFQAVNPSDPNRVGLGAQRLSVRRALTYGTINNSQNPLDMAIGGDGWFRILSDKNDPKSLNYTRNGQFAVAKDGFIVNENGMYLTGYQPSADGSSVTDTLGTLKMPDDYANGEQTDTSRIDVVLDSRENAFVKGSGVAFDPAQNTFNSKTTQIIYDSNGTSHTLETYYRRVTDSQLQITSGAGGYTYSPGEASSPNTLSTTSVTIPKTSVMTVQTAPITTLLGSATGKTAVGTGNATINLSGTTVAGAALAVGDKVYMNGVDTGLTVATAVTSGSSVSTITVAGTPTIDIPSNASFTFYKADVAATATDTTLSATTDGKAWSIINTPTAGLSVGQRLFVNGIDSGVNIAAIGTGTVTLDGPLPSSVKSGAALASTSLVFKQSLDMTLIAPDATNLVVQGTTNKQASNTILNAVQSNVEVYASIDGKFYNHTDPTNTYGNREITEDVPGAGGYGAVARIGLVAGRNIDSLVTDFGTGKPLFSTKVTLTTKVSNGSQQSTTIPLIYDLDLSNTQLQASSFQVTASVQDGEPRSELASVSIDDGGNIVGIYGNGRKIFAGQVALTHFDASQQLVPTGGNSFAPSYMSGTEGDVGVTVGRPGEGSFGALKQNAVEQSNVDLSNELVKLMILQRSYSANSQSMRAFDQTLQDTIRMTS